ncbi:hypothetical protein J1605_004293 [Eschrichtius robustus]|uniref:Voltage-dependent calcium channel alpha-2/delta subunit conserved region domain-containing protein n=1 Tax=Eschrichtius robustus TaxID=9764 RepID=A0AB34HK31_ESCRO|nr:hypothetical protein J1605_004293 [Eschrichtius robustus]
MPGLQETWQRDIERPNLTSSLAIPPNPVPKHPHGLAFPAPGSRGRADEDGVPAAYVLGGHPAVRRCGGSVPGELPGQCELPTGVTRWEREAAPNPRPPDGPAPPSLQPGLHTEGPRMRSGGQGPGDLDCFVIDNNGFILISERPQEMGRFLGEVDGALMTQLLSMGVFSQVTMYDYQAMCKPPTHHHSASQPLVSCHPHIIRDPRDATQCDDRHRPPYSRNFPENAAFRCFRCQKGVEESPGCGL